MQSMPLKLCQNCYIILLKIRNHHSMIAKGVNLASDHIVMEHKSEAIITRCQH